MAGVVGLLLAAGAGQRMGTPKALVIGDGGIPWVVSATRALRAGGCTETVVVIGAAAPRVRSLLAPESVSVVDAIDWEEGMGASLRAGLAALATVSASAALIHLVDLPDVGSDVIARVIGLADPAILARASYQGRPGHPVLIGREHWDAVAEEATQDRGARAYLAGRKVISVDCSDLATGIDVDFRGSMLGG